ncbi:MAG TPA: ABC transporter permease [Blastocatellia bacterium]|jgi:putative ABC transport system permease protein
METLLQDIRYSIRVLLKSPAVTTVALITLTLGIGATSAIFSVVNAVLLRPLPYEEPDKLVFITERSPVLEGMSVAYPNFLDWREQNGVFDKIGVYRRVSFNLTGSGDPDRFVGGEVSADVFNALRAKPIIGRTFLDEEDKAGASPVVVLSYGLWQRRFGKGADIVGQTLTLNGKPHTVVGIMPPDFRFPSGVDLWVPVGLNADNPSWVRGNHPGLYAIARLKPGATIEQAQAEMETIAVRLEQQYPQSNTGNRVAISPLLNRIVGDVRPALLILLAAVGLVLLIACVNVANLLLARAAARQKEIAVRMALGATRSRLIRQLLTESVMLSVAGGALGLLLAAWGTDLLVAISPNNVPRFAEIKLDNRVFAFTAAIAVVTGILFGLAPALHASKLNLNEMLKEGGRGATAGFRRQRVRSLLVISEVAVALVLLISAGLLIKSFLRLQQVDPGFKPDNVLTAGIPLPRTKYLEPTKRIAFYESLFSRIASLPAVEAVGAVSELPVEGGSQTFFVVEDRPLPPPEEIPLTEYSLVSTGYFKAMGLRLLSGREFNEQDVRDAPLVCIIDQNFAEQYWPGQDPIGKRMKYGGANPDNPWATIVGVVANVKYQGLDQESPRVQTYMPYTQSTFLGASLVIRTAGDPARLAAAVRSEVMALDPDLPVFDVRTMNDVLKESVAPRRLYMTLLGLFAGVAVTLAAIGLYGVMSYSVTQRTHELGIRMALGARQRDVLRLVVGQGMALAFAGIALGVIGAFGLTWLLSSLLFSVSATDPIIFIAIPLILAGVALGASFVPARRATKVDPMVALRYE